MRALIVVDNLRDWPVDIPGTEVVATRDYVANPDYSRLRNVRLFNFCRSLRYQSAGYYVSLLGAARGHRPMPDVMTIQDLKSRSVIKLSTTDIEGVIQKSLKPLASNEFAISIYFGRNLARRYKRLSRQLFNLFPAPLMRARFARRAALDGQVVIDDPESILRCTNKVFLAELLERHRIGTPKTMIVHRDNQQCAPDRRRDRAQGG